MKIYDTHSDVFSNLYERHLNNEKNIFATYHQDNMQKGELKGGIWVVYSEHDFDVLEAYNIALKEFAPYKVVEETIEELFSIVEKCKYEGHTSTEMSNVAYKLYNNLIVERDREGRIIRLPNGAYQISRRRQRDFGFFIRDYNMIDSRRKIPTRYNKRIKLEEETKLKLTQKTKEE